MDYSQQNSVDREFFSKDFSVINVLLQRIRNSFISGETVSLSDLDFDGIIDYDSNLTFVYITLFQAGQKPYLWNSL